MRYSGIVFGLFLTANICIAATIHVPADQPTIQAGIDATGAGDTIIVAPGTYYEHLLVDHSIFLFGAEGAENTFIDGQAQTMGQNSSIVTLLDAGYVKINGITITGGRGYHTTQGDSLFGGFSKEGKIMEGIALPAHGIDQMRQLRV